MGAGSSQSFKIIQHLAYGGDKALKGWKDGLPFEGLPFPEVYLEGRMRIACVFVPTASDEGKTGVLAEITSKIDTGKDSRAAVGIVDRQRSIAGREHDFRGQENDMLVSDVQGVQIEQIELSAYVRLSLIENVSDYFVAGGGLGCFMSINGAFNRLPVSPVDGEVALVQRFPVIGLDECAPRVIQASPEIVQSIAKDGWSVFRESGADSTLHPLICLGVHSLHVLRDVRVESRFKLLDVFFGPL